MADQVDVLPAPRGDEAELFRAFNDELMAPLRSRCALSRNVLSSLHSLFELAVRRRWVSESPCRFVDRPAARPSGDIRFLSHEELLAVLEGGVPDDPWGALERPLYLMAAITGLRQGELLALRWGDLDFASHKVRVRRAFVRGEFKAPKSVRGVRGVPLAVPLEESLLGFSEVSRFTADEDLVFGHPETGDPLDRSKVRKRFQRACRRAGVRALPRPTAHVRDALGRIGRGVAANASGVDGPARRQDHAHLRRLPAG
jgi:integrase